MPENPKVCYTVGAAGVNPQQFIDALRAHGITIVLDVRGFPAHDNIKQHLAKFNILYGACEILTGMCILTDTEYYSNSKIGIGKLRTDPRVVYFIDKCEELLNTGHRIAILHSAADPLDDRKAVIVARLLISRGLDCKHIVATKGGLVVELHDALEARLLDWYVAHPAVGGGTSHNV